jgi:hypothetical protein
VYFQPDEEDSVRFLRISIAEIMAIVALAALDCLALRMGRSPAANRCLVFAGMPMQIILAIGLLPILRRRRRRETPSRFLVGFEVGGGICLLAYVSACVQATESLVWHLTSTLTPVLNALGFLPYSTADYTCRYGLAMAYLTAPQLAAALVAGWINHSGFRHAPADLTAFSE